MHDYSDHDGLALAAMVRGGDVTALELVDAAIDRIERHDDTLGAIRPPRVRRGARRGAPAAWARI